MFVCLHILYVCLSTHLYVHLPTHFVCSFAYAFCMFVCLRILYVRLPTHFVCSSAYTFCMFVCLHILYVCLSMHFVCLSVSANILLSKDWRGKLGDFGLARVMPTPPSSSQQLTSMLTATIVGTHVYMAPETRGGTITPAADVYAFGVVSQELSHPDSFVS